MTEELVSASHTEMVCRDRRQAKRETAQPHCFEETYTDQGEIPALQNEDSIPAAPRLAAGGISNQAAFETLPRQPLGAGTIIAGCFAVFFRHIVLVSVVSLVPMLLGQLIPGILLGNSVGFDQSRLQQGSFLLFALSLTMSFMLLVSYTLTSAILVQLAYDAKLDRPIQVLRYIRPAFSALPAILILSIAVLLMLVAGQMLMMLFSAAAAVLAILAIPAAMVFYLWILGTFSVLAPVVVIEKMGLHSLGRSAALTRGYRWQIIGTIFLTGMCTLGIYFVAGLVVSLVSYVSPLLGGLLFGAVSMAGTGVLSIAVSLIYARLREIKEGVGLDQIASVFD